MRKEREILAKTFFLENTLHIWKYFVLNIRADSSRLLQIVLLSYGYMRITLIFYKNNFIKTQGSFFAQNLRTIKSQQKNIFSTFEFK